MTRHLALATVLALSLPAAATEPECEIVGLGGASEYNVVTLHDFSGENSEIQGRAAIGDDMNVKNYGIATHLSAGAGTVLSVGGDATLNNGQVYGGDAEVGGTCSVTSWGMPDGSLSCSDSGAFDATSLATEMQDISDAIDGQAVNGTTSTTSWGGVYLSGTDPDLNVFELDLDSLGFASWVWNGWINTFSISAPAGSIVMINVKGDAGSTGPLFKNGGISTSYGLGASDIVWNFNTQTDLTIKNVSVPGSILAPNADLDFSNGNTNGTIVVYSASGGGEYHDAPFGGEICEPPEGDPCPYEDEDNALGPAGAYNVFTFGKFTGTGSDIGGKVAIGGTAYFNGYGIASTESSGGVVLSVYDSAVIVNSQIYGGDGEVGGTCSTASLGTPDGTLTCSLGSSVFNTGDHESDLGDLSDYIAALPANGTVTSHTYGTVELTAGSDDLQVFDLDLDTVKAGFGSGTTRIDTMNITADSDQTVVVNVTGDTSIFLQSMGFALSGGVGFEDILFHFPDSTSLTIDSITVPGAVFAPLAAIQFDRGNIEGTTIAKSIKGTGEFHFFEFEGTICPVD